MSELDILQPMPERLARAASSGRRWAVSAPAAIALAGALLCAAAVTMVAASASRDAAFGRGLIELLIVGTPIAAGLYALHTSSDRRFAYALIWVGFAWSLTALGESSLSVPYTIGRLSNWLIFPCVAYLLLAFPVGRVAAGLDRALLAGVVALTAVFFYGMAPLVQAYPVHTLWATCTTDCPPNAVAVVDESPAFLPSVVVVREWLVMLLWAGLAWSMARRFRAASPLRRQAMAPVFSAAAVLGVLHVSFHAARQLGAPAETVVALASAWTLAIVGVCGAFLFGLLWRRMLLARTLAGLGHALRASDSPEDVRRALAAAFGDRSVELLFRDPESGRWHDTLGRARTWPRPLPEGRAATVIGDGERADEAVLVHDVALRDDRELLDGVSGIVLAGRRHERLAADLAQAMSDLETSRRRIAQAAAHERVRIERDLHDGAQQRLIALGIKLEHAEQRLQTDPVAASDELRELGLEVDRALAELRSLAQGVYPSALTELGVAGALRSLELRRNARLPIHVTDEGVGRHASEVESAVYFTCVEALQNAMKHAAAATGVWVRLGESRDALRFEVRDDGAGAPADVVPGRGLRNMRDRIESVGGRLSVERHSRGGTRVSGWVPVARDAGRTPAG